MCISGIYAFSNTSILSLKNEVNTGAINIELKEYTIKQGQEFLYTDNETAVLPGQIISLIPRISNIGDASYVRAKLAFTSEDEGLVQLSDDDVKGMSENWVKIGEYWYYKNIINSGENIDLFKEVIIPIDIPNEFQGKSIELNITAEAIQANNFSPDFNSSSPWNGINATESNTTYHSDKIQINSKAVIEYENSANLYINVPENFFHKLGHILPGDTISEEITINNTKESEVEYFLSTDKVDGTSQKSLELLEKLQLKIISPNGVIYDGKAYKIDNCSLGKYSPKTLTNLKFTITVPIELDNEYADLMSEMKWSFSVEKQQEKTEEKSPQTGDYKFKIAITIFAISTIGLIVVLYFEKKQKDKKGGN